MLRVGLTGGMGAGKSTVATLLAGLGAVVIDSDKIAREVVEPGTPGLAALVDAFGAGIVRPDGHLDRPALAAVAFTDDAARAKLNSITHPLVGQRTAALVAAAPADAIVVQDIPLLVENGLGPLFNLVVVVGAPVAERVRRLVTYRQISADDARARIAAQASDTARRAAADVWLDNSGTNNAITKAVQQLWENRLVPFEANIRTGTAAASRPALVPPDPLWPAQAQRLAARLRAVCGAKAVRIDHIGSTAVPGLPATDVIDLQITVAGQPAIDELAAPLTAAGFPAQPLAGAGLPPTNIDPEQLATAIHHGADPGRPVNIHLRIAGSAAQRSALLLRDWLRAEPGPRAEYLEVKRHAATVAASQPGELATRHAYNQAKEAWLQAAATRANDWAQRRGWTMSAS